MLRCVSLKQSFPVGGSRKPSGDIGNYREAPSRLNRTNGEIDRKVKKNKEAKI